MNIYSFVPNLRSRAIPEHMSEFVVQLMDATCPPAMTRDPKVYQMHRVNSYDYSTVPYMCLKESDLYLEFGDVKYNEVRYVSAEKCQHNHIDILECKYQVCAQLLDSRDISTMKY